MVAPDRRRRRGSRSLGRADVPSAERPDGERQHADDPDRRPEIKCDRWRHAREERIGLYGRPDPVLGSLREDRRLERPDRSTPEAVARQDPAGRLGGGDERTYVEYGPDPSEHTGHPAEAESDHADGSGGDGGKPRPQGEGEGEQDDRLGSQEDHGE